VAAPSFFVCLFCFKSTLCERTGEENRENGTRTEQEANGKIEQRVFLPLRLLLVVVGDRISWFPFQLELFVDDITVS